AAILARRTWWANGIPAGRHIDCGLRAEAPPRSFIGSKTRQTLVTLSGQDWGQAIRRKKPSEPNSQPSSRVSTTTVRASPIDADRGPSALQAAVWPGIPKPKGAYLGSSGSTAALVFRATHQGPTPTLPFSQHPEDRQLTELPLPRPLLLDLGLAQTQYRAPTGSFRVFRNPHERKPLELDGEIAGLLD
ncbi:hypothetical protein LX36DRAFT_674871, partial [Colletotrichum falcatum]